MFFNKLYIVWLNIFIIMDELNNKKIIGIISILLAMILLLWPDFLVYIVAVILVVYGIIKIVDY